MAITNRQQNQFTLWFNKVHIVILFSFWANQSHLLSQCLSSVNPVGGTENLLVLEKNTLRVIAFYKYGQGNQYYTGSKHADFDMVDKAFYNYLTSFIGYGLNNKLAVESEWGYFINKTQLYNTQPEYKLRGYGFSNLVLSARFGLYAENFKRIHLSMALGIKIPFSRNPQLVDYVELPVEVQPTLGAYGLVLNTAFVKESSGKGLRYFFTNRVETNFTNKNDYRLGTAIYSSAYISKHLMFSWVKGDWTAIMQLRSEIRLHDKISDHRKESSGSMLFFAVPQINWFIKEQWNLSAMMDIPVYQYFNGTQLGAGVGVTFSMARSFGLHHH